MDVVHISDLIIFYALLTKTILRKEQLPSGKDGYYFVTARSVYWWDILDGLAVALHARGLVTEPTTRVWPSDEVAGEAFGVPAQYAQSIFNAQ